MESLCPPVVAQTRPKEGCDPASPRRLRRGRDVLMEDSMVAVDTGRISMAQDPDVVSGIHVMPDCVPAAMPMLAAAPQAASEVAQTRTRGDCSMNLLLPEDGSMEPLDDDAPEVLSSGKGTCQRKFRSRQRCLCGSGSAPDSDIRDDSSFRKVDGKVCLEPG